MSVCKKLFLFALLLFFISGTSHSQTVLQGTVVDADSGTPLAGVNVYLAGTTFGESTDKNGNYEFKVPTEGNYNLIFSFVGYKKQVYTIELTSSSYTITTDAELKQKVENLKEIGVVASNEKWREQFDMFFNQFIGKSEYAEEVTIKNPWVLTFRERDNNLIATAEKPLKIVNEALGYRIHAELVKFVWPKYMDQGGSYKIYPKYKALSPKTEEQRRRWERNRIKNYLGSFAHFLKSLYNDNLKQSNFSVRGTWHLSSLSQGKTQYKLKTTTGISHNMREDFKGFKLNRKIQVAYEKVVSYQVNGELHSISIEKYGAVEPNTQDHLFYVNKNGYLLDPASLKVYKNWARERVANSLPTDYSIEDYIE